MDSLAFLERVERLKPQPIYVVHGDEPFLKRQVLTALRKLVLGPEPEGFAQSTHPGDKASFAAVRNDLTTLPFLSPRRLVIVENADPFITRERKKLEKYVAEPSATGVLVLDVATWVATTNLAKTLGDAALSCKAPQTAKLSEWCRKWCAAQHGKQLGQEAARLLVDLVGADMGQLDQELNKLALYVGETVRIENADVDKLVGNSREESTWKLFDLIAGGQPGPVLVLLDRLFTQGDQGLKLLGAISSKLRPLVQAARLHTQGVALGAALEQAGIPPWGRQNAEQLLRHLGRRRLERVYDWLLRANLDMKSSGQLPERVAAGSPARAPVANGSPLAVKKQERVAGQQRTGGRQPPEDALARQAEKRGEDALPLAGGASRAATRTASTRLPASALPWPAMS